MLTSFIRCSYRNAPLPPPDPVSFSPDPDPREKAGKGGKGDRGKGSARGKPVGGKGGMPAFCRIFVFPPSPRRVVPSHPCDNTAKKTTKPTRTTFQHRKSAPKKRPLAPLRQHSKENNEAALNFIPTQIVRLRRGRRFSRLRSEKLSRRNRSFYSILSQSTMYYNIDNAQT